MGRILTDISIKDAMKVIRAAKKLGVTSMKLGTLEFELSDEPRVSRPTLKVSAKKIAEQNIKNQLEMDFSEVKDELSTLHVEDPVGFEQALIDGQLDEFEGGDTSEEALGQ